MPTCCLSCGVEKDCSALESYPYDGEYDRISGTPGVPLLCVECQNYDEGAPPWDFRMAILCYGCFHRLGENTKGVDMWISSECWKTLGPLVPFDRLPRVAESGDDRTWDPRTYAGEKPA